MWPSVSCILSSRNSRIVSIPSMKRILALCCQTVGLPLQSQPGPLQGWTLGGGPGGGPWGGARGAHWPPGAAAGRRSAAPPRYSRALRDRALRDRELRDRALQDRELRDRELRDRELRDRELQDRVLRDRELRSEMQKMRGIFFTPSREIIVYLFYTKPPPPFTQRFIILSQDSLRFLFSALGY